MVLRTVETANISKKIAAVTLFIIGGALKQLQDYLTEPTRTRSSRLHT
jgi:hypothetical protein